ncbi:hypothetical protein Apa02nite_031370 [Actinoplanes palleronii]|uniref:Uncharacterized protein n=1 Tax=Actinoplanes palleronii TaxID=113570 RepID=A0ABQ4B8M9_9ACTN|nr:hypothetical protein Apa02nite_031370 [Actinoplanes palleronii]
MVRADLRRSPPVRLNPNGVKAFGFRWREEYLSGTLGESRRECSPARVAFLPVRPRHVEIRPVLWTVRRRLKA